MTEEVSKKINEATDIVTLQNKDICNRIRSTENDIKKHINAAEECILEALDGLKVDNIVIRKILKEQIDKLFDIEETTTEQG